MGDQWSILGPSLNVYSLSLQHKRFTGVDLIASSCYSAWWALIDVQIILNFKVVIKYQVAFFDGAHCTWAKIINPVTILPTHDHFCHPYRPITSSIITTIATPLPPQLPSLPHHLQWPCCLVWLFCRFLEEMAPFLTSNFCYMIYIMMQCREDRKSANVNLFLYWLISYPSRYIFAS